MDAAELRATQAPIKERYKADPKSAVITLKAKGSIDNEGIACKVETGRALAVATCFDAAPAASAAWTAAGRANASSKAGNPYVKRFDMTRLPNDAARAAVPRLCPRLREENGMMSLPAPHPS